MEEGIGQSIIYNKNASTRLDELIVCLSGCQNVRTRAFHIAFYAFTKRPAPSYSGGQGIGPRRSFVVLRRRRIIIIIMRNSLDHPRLFLNLTAFQKRPFQLRNEGERGADIFRLIFSQETTYISGTRHIYQGTCNCCLAM